MPKNQLTDAEVIKAKIAARTSVITTIITVAGTLIGLAITAIWGPILLQKMNSTPTPTVQSTALPRNWYVVFELKFPSNYWAEGTHDYLFKAACPFSINSTKTDEPHYSFSVAQTATAKSSPIYIRRKGLFDVEILGASIGNTINPAQETIALYAPLATSFEEAKQLENECKVQISIDQGAFVDLSPTRIDKISD
jgi:hypothetical protein